ncbi:ribonuclease P protein component [Psychroflexus aestuariivivens]|uniref:ribonuclease P protein component n=1 Tax=Psychroflexus aestuariivivens TaxID=1795040 RepID=UPI000FD6C2DC|nr:ribonuclease P protein component [Psychroflexus aestuariivivens]
MSSQNLTFNSSEKLKSRKLIQSLFESGQSLKKYPILIRFQKIETELNSVGVSVSKRNFKSAVDRIRIKRQLREAYRLNKHKIYNRTDSRFAIMIIFIGRKHLPSETIHEQVAHLLQNIE